ncbi:MAG: chromosome segregation protein SMC [Clostridia bacterium]|nr:chromosome segregation protein SMC [Clostridia bacterium]
MRLKSLELQGFKSFPDKTTLHFDNGATVIVGPNGSGKSNITDAMRWVLGEISSKTLRSSKLEDVVFIGTESRKPMSFAEVSITFDNSSEEGRLNSDYDTITVTRRYIRGGDSEFLINKSPVRLKDITELFRDTGVGREGYSIIGQGRIAEIISKKSEDRRNIFEEAAGIAKVRVKKEISEKDLKQTQDNIEKVEGTFELLSKNVRHLEHAAEKAKKYFEIYERKKVADVSLWIYDSQKMKNDIQQFENNYKLTQHELEMVDNTMKQIEAQDASLYDKKLEADKKREQIYFQIKSCNNTLSELNSALNVMDNNVAHAKMSSHEQIIELEKLEAKKGLIESEIESKKIESSGINTSLNEILGKQEMAIKERNKIISLINTAEKQLEDLLIELKALEVQKNDITVKLSVLENSQSTGDERKENLSSEISKYDNELNDLNKNLDSLTKVIEDYEKKLGGLEKSLSTLEKEIEEKTYRYDELKEEMSIFNSKALALRERINALTAMEELFDGYIRSVGYIMNAYNKGELPNCGKVHGPISTLIDVPKEYVTAIEVALGAGLQNIVVDNENTAKACIIALKENKMGRATFYPISSVTGQRPTQEMIDAKKYKGYVGVADELIEFDEKYSQIFSSLLGRTVIFDNIDNATSMAKDKNYKVKVVTLDGQQINVGGSFTGGSVKNEGSVLSRSNEIKSMEDEEEQIKIKLVDIKQEGQKLGESLRSLTSQRLSDKQQFDLLDTLYREEKLKYDTLVAQIKLNRDLVESLMLDKKGLTDKDEANKSEAEKLKDSMKSAVSRINEISTTRGELDEKRYEYVEQSEKLNSIINENGIKIAEIKKDLESSNNSVNDSVYKLEELVAEIAYKKKRMEEIKQEESSSAEKSAENRKLFTEAEKRLQELEEEHKSVLDFITELERKRNELTIKNKDAAAKRAIILESNLSSKAKLEQLQIDFDRMVERLSEEYGLTYSTAIELGYPEVTSKNRKEVLAVVNECKESLKTLGNVNSNAIEEYKEAKEQYDHYYVQLTDLMEARKDLDEQIKKLEEEMSEKFINAFNSINDNFNTVFKELFGGGHAELSLTDPNDVLNCGIEIKAAPPGKVIKSLMLLSGGEQSFVAIALLFAILKVNPTPFCIFDEVEAALDDVNVTRFGQYIKRYSNQTQFIIITHRRGTMEIADRLYGVTMQQKGISKVLTMDINDVGKDKILRENPQ